MFIEFHCFSKDDKNTYRSFVNIANIERIFEDMNDDRTVLILRGDRGPFLGKMKALVVDEPYESVVERIMTNRVHPTKTSPAQALMYTADEIFGQI